MKPSVLFVMPELDERIDSGSRLHTKMLVEELAGLANLTVLVIGERAPDAIPAVPRADWTPITKGSMLTRAVDFGVGFLLGRQVVLQRSLRLGAAQALVDAADRARPAVIVLQRPFYGPLITVARQLAPTIVDADESTSKVMRLVARHPPSLAARVRAILEFGVYRRLESSLARANEVWVSSDVEAAQLRSDVRGIKTRTIPNAIDAHRFDLARTVPLGSSGAAYVGIYSYPPNEEAATWIIRELAAAFIEADLGGIDLIGRRPTKRMLTLAAGRPNVHIVGELDDAWGAIRASGILLVPLRSGAGTRWKILEAMACQVPVVSTAFGVQGLEVVADTHYLRAETAAEFVAAVRALRRDPHQRDRLIRNARALVESSYSRTVVRTKIGAALSELAPAASERGSVAAPG